MKHTIYNTLLQDLPTKNPTPDQIVEEPPTGYGIPSKVEKIFEIITEQPEY